MQLLTLLQLHSFALQCVELLSLSRFLCSTSSCSVHRVARSCDQLWWVWSYCTAVQYCSTDHGGWCTRPITILGGERNYSSLWCKWMIWKKFSKKKVAKSFLWISTALYCYIPRTRTSRTGFLRYISSSILWCWLSTHNVTTHTVHSSHSSRWSVQLCGSWRQWPLPLYYCTLRVCDYTQ